MKVSRFIHSLDWEKSVLKLSGRAFDAIFPMVDMSWNEVLRWD